MAKERRPETTRTAILDAAEALFLERGFAGTSTSEIAKAAAVTKSLIHHHFGSKDRLWAEIKQTRFSAYYDRQLAIFGAAGLDEAIARASMAAYFGLLRERPQILRMMWWRLLETDAAVTEDLAVLRQVAVDRIRGAQAAGTVRADIAPKFVLVAFLGLVHAWFTEQTFVSAQDGEADAYLASAMKIFVDGVMVDSRAPTPAE